MVVHSTLEVKNRSGLKEASHRQKSHSRKLLSTWNRLLFPEPVGVSRATPSRVKFRLAGDTYTEGNLQSPILKKCSFTNPIDGNLLQCWMIRISPLGLLALPVSTTEDEQREQGWVAVPIRGNSLTQDLGK